MTNKEQIELQTKLDEIAQFAEDVAALAFTHNRQTAAKFRRIARYARDISTCVRLHGQIPLEKEAPAAVQLVARLHQLSSLIPATVDMAKRTVR